MKSSTKKKYPTIGCCGIDCGLCPRFYTTGTSKCPGCLGKDFRNFHPSCSIITCCVKTKNYETCADCEELPCKRIEKWDQVDSFVTHRDCFRNLQEIRRNGIESFITQHKLRMKFLRNLLEKYDDGRSKSFYCLSAALLPVDSMNSIVAELSRSEPKPIDRKESAKMLRKAFTDVAAAIGIDLKYRKKA